jgi:hypothetical protein
MSAFEGYISFGGNELVNNSRVRGIAQSAQPCPMFWLKGPECPTLEAALDQVGDYSWSQIASAPWYDPDRPDVSSRFFGLYAYEFDEVLDSTRTVTGVENIDDGGVLGRTRKAMKNARVKGILMGQGRDAIEYGQFWLNAALDPNACGQHGIQCGLTDLVWLADCPPALSDFQGGTYVQNPPTEQWVLEATNLAFVRGANYGTSTGIVTRTIVDGDALYTFSGSPSGGTTDAFVVRPLQTGPDAGDRTAVVAGDLYTGRIEVAANRPRGMRLRVVFRSATATIGQAVSPFYAPEVDGTFKAGSEFSWTVPMGATTMEVLVESGAVTDGSTPAGFQATDTVGLRVLVQKRETPTYSAFTTARRNVVLNPSFGAGFANWANYFTPTRALDATDFVTPPQSNKISKGAGNLNQGQRGLIFGTLAEQPVSTPYHIVARVKAPVGRTYQVSPVYDSGTGNQPVVMVGDGTWQTVVVDGISRATAPTVLGIVVISLATMNVGLPVGDVLFAIDSVSQEWNTTGPYFDAINHDPINDALTQYVWEAGTNASASLMQTRTITSPAPAPVGLPFTGDTADTATTRYAWLGTPDLSASTFEVLELVPTPPTFVPDYADPEAAWTAAVDSLVRYLHGVAAVSGSLITGTLNSGDFWAYLVEITFEAERPWVYGKTRELDLPPTTPVVVQDIPFNLVPYPSAELQDAAAVVVATNYSTNPSVETNATGWGTSGDGTVILNAALVGARSTELAANGAASFRSLWTAAAASAVPGYFIISQDVLLPHAVVAGERYSVNMWAAVSVQAGAPVMTSLDVRALWRNAALATLGQDTIGGPIVPAAGVGVVTSLPATLRGIAPPVGADRVNVRAVLMLASWNAGTIVRLYADALAVTVP